MCEGGTSCHCPLRTARGPRWAPHKGRRRLSPDPPPWPGRLQVSARPWATLPARRGSSGEAMGRVGRRAPERGWQPRDSRGAHRGEGKSCSANARSRRRGPAPLLLSLLLLLFSSLSSFSSPPPPSSPPALPRAHFLLWQPPKPLLCASPVSPAALRAGPGAGTVPVRYVPAPPRPSAAVLPARAQSQGRSPELARWLPRRAAEKSALKPAQQRRIALSQDTRRAGPGGNARGRSRLNSFQIIRQTVPLHDGTR